jgi:hypothetical protein
MKLKSEVRSPKSEAKSAIGYRPSAIDADEA